MATAPLTVPLPPPWRPGMSVELGELGPITYLVGPNGSGKTRFARELARLLPGSRLLNADRLAEISLQNPGFRGDPFQQGYSKQHFPQLAREGVANGSAVDTFILLDQQLATRIRVEASLGQLFGRMIKLHWDSGNLVPLAQLGPGSTYRLDRDECHGIRELVVLLAQLYGPGTGPLVVDEPELNLHPQYQSFLMQEVRRVTGGGDGAPRKKVVLATHSPFILDLRSTEDLRSVISFASDFRPPARVPRLETARGAALRPLLPRLNAHHKQLFFSDAPIFVEGIRDAQLLAAIQEARGASFAGAGSCLIDAGGCEELTQYFALCRDLGKTAWFLFDLDSLFTGSLRACVRDDGAVQAFLRDAGLGGDFRDYCGELDQALTPLARQLAQAGAGPGTDPLRGYLASLGDPAGWDPPRLAKARLAVLTAVGQAPEVVEGAVGAGPVADVRGRLAKVAQALAERNIILLTDGPLEAYMRSFGGNLFAPPDKAKQDALSAEVDWLSGGRSDDELRGRYRGLFEAVGRLPAAPKVDHSAVAMEYLRDFIYRLQQTARRNARWGPAEIQSEMRTAMPSESSVFRVENFERRDGGFGADIVVEQLLGGAAGRVHVTDRTNAAGGALDLAPAAAGTA